MLRPVLDPVLGRDILSRYTAFASSVGAPAPMEHLMPDGAAQPARYETYVENLQQVTQAIRKNYVINLQMDLRFLALQLASAMEQAGRTETRRVQMLERQITILQDEAGRLKAAPLPHNMVQKPSSGRLPGANVPAYGLAAVKNARRAALAPLQQLTPERSGLADPVPPAQRVLAKQDLPQSRTKGLAEDLLLPSVRQDRQEQNKGEARLPSPSPAQRVLPDPQTAAPDGAKKRTGESRVSPERPEPGPPAGQAPAAMAGTPAALPSGGAVRQQATRETPVSAAGLPTGTGRSVSNRPTARVPLGHMEPDVQDAENAPLPDPRPARLLRPEPSQRVLRTDAPERASIWQEKEGSPSFVRPLLHGSPAQPAKTADKGIIPGTTGNSSAVPSAGHIVGHTVEKRSAAYPDGQAGGEPQAAYPTTEITKTRHAPDLAAVPLVHTAAENRREMPATSRIASEETASGALPGTQDLSYGKTGNGSNAELIAVETSAVTSVRPAPGVAAAPLVHAAAAQAEKEPVRGTAPGNPPSHAVVSAPQKSDNRQKPVPARGKITSDAARTAPVPMQEAAAAVIRPAPDMTAAPLVHATPAQADKEPARVMVPGKNSSSGTVAAPQRESDRQMPAPAGRESISAAARTAPAPAREPAAVAVRPAPGVAAAPLVHAAPAQTDKEPARGTVPGQTSSDVAAPASQRGNIKKTTMPESGSHALSGNLPSRTRSNEQTTPLRQVPAVAAAPLVYASGGTETPLSSQIPLRGTGEGSTPKTSTSDSSRTAVTAAMPKAAETLRTEAVFFRRLDSFVRAPMIPAAGNMPHSTREPISTATGTATNARPASAVSAALSSAAPARKLVPDGADRVLLSAANSGGTPGAAVPGPALREPMVPAGSPAPMELRRGRTPAAPMTSAPGTSSWEPGEIRTVHRTRTVQRENKQETPSTVTVHLPGQSMTSTAAAIGPAEVERIAEKVYRQIEERLRSEKMRRGM